MTASIAIAAGVQAIATIVLVLITWKYVRLISTQVQDTARLAEATEQSVQVLVQRERSETLQALRVVRQAGDKLCQDAERWVGQNVVNLVWTRSFPANNSFALENAEEVISAAAKVGGQVEKLMVETLTCADRVRSRLAALRSLQHAVNERAAEAHAEPFRSEVGNVKDTADKVRRLAQEEIARMEREEQATRGA